MKKTKPERTYNNIDSWFFYENDVSSITRGSKTTMKCETIKMFAVLAEVDILGKFATQLESLEKLEELSLFRWVIRIRIKMPMTFDNREVVVLGFGFVDPSDKTIYLPFRSIDKNHYSDLICPEEQQNYKRIDINYGFFHLTIIDDKTVELINCYNVDPKVPVIPWVILNTFLKEISYYIMEDLKKQIENVEFGLYEDRIKKNQKFYDSLYNKVKK